MPNIHRFACVAIGTHFGCIFGVKYLIKTHGFQKRYFNDNCYITNVSWSDTEFIGYTTMGGILGSFAGYTVGFIAPQIALSVHTGILISLLLIPSLSRNHIHFQDHFEYMIRNLKKE